MPVIISFSEQWVITSLSHSPGSFSCHQLVLFSSLPPRMMDFWYRAPWQAGFATAAHLGFPAQYGFPSVAIPQWDKKQMAGQTQSFVLFSFSIHLIFPQAVTSSNVASPPPTHAHANINTQTYLFLELFTLNCLCLVNGFRWVERGLRLNHRRKWSRLKIDSNSSAAWGMREYAVCFHIDIIKWKAGAHGS